MALDPQKRRTMLALSYPSIFHGAVEQSLLGKPGQKLWRIDELRGSTYLMILSEEEPDLTRAVAELGFDGEAWESRDYSPLLNRIAEGTVWNFRLCANPTYSEMRPGQRGKVHAHRTPEQQLRWLFRQGEKNGFCVSPEAVTVTKSQWYQFGKGNEDGAKHTVRLLAVTYDGILKVTDADLMKQALKQGIGREKAYGMGLMTLVGGGGRHG